MLGNILRRLPSLGGSHFIEERRGDPDVVERLLDQEDDDDAPSWSPAGTEWRQSDELLTKIYDQLTALVAIWAAHPIPQGGRRPDIPPPHPRPTRTLDRVRAQRQAAQLEEWDDEVEEAKARWRQQAAEGDLPADN